MMARIRVLLKRVDGWAAKTLFLWMKKNVPTFTMWAATVLVWRDTRRRAKDYALFLRLFKDPKTDMEKIVGGQALHMAKAMMMNWLDTKRVMHCRFCPNTDQLKWWGTAPNDYLVCQGHMKMLEAGAKVVTVPNPQDDAGKAASATAPVGAVS